MRPWARDPVVMVGIPEPSLGSMDRTLLLAIGICFLDTFAIGLVNPIYPQLVQSDRLGATLFAALQSVSNAAALCASTIFGRLSDVHGRRSAVVCSTLTTFTGYALYQFGYSFGHGRPSVRLFLPAAGRVVGGIGRSALSGPLLALLTEQSADPSARVSRTMATFGLGYALGSASGGFVVANSGPATTLALICLCSLVQVTLAMLLPRAPINRPTLLRQHGAAASVASAGGSWKLALREALGLRRMRVLLLLQAFAALSFQVYDATSALYVTNALGFSSEERGYLLAYAGWVFSFMSFAVVPRLVSAGQPRKMLAVAFGCNAVGRLGLAAAVRLPALPCFVVSYLVLNLGQGMQHTLLKALTSATATGPDRLGLMLGLLGSTERGCGVLAPLLGGPAYEWLGPPAPACLAAFFALVGCAATTLVQQDAPVAGQLAKKEQ